MTHPAGAQPAAAPQQTVRLARLLPAGDPAPIAEIVADMGLWERVQETPARPRVMLNMVSTADGRATVQGRSGPISDGADRALFHGLRGAVDAVLVGAGTVRAERYGRIVPDPERRRERVRRGLAEEPLACIVSGRLGLEPDIPLLADPAARVVVLTPAPGSLPASAAHVEYVRAERDGRLDLAGALGELASRFGVQSVLCEGGPHLADELLMAGALDELFLSLAPVLAGGEGPGSDALRILAGAALDPPVRMELLGANLGGSHLFLRYGVCARERVSRETMPSSSLAR